jgi:hypothetical protein
VALRALLTGQLHALLAETHVEPAATGLRVAFEGGDVDQDGPGGLEVARDALGVLAGQQALSGSRRRIDGSHHQHPHVGDG